MLVMGLTFEGDGFRIAELSTLQNETALRGRRQGGPIAGVNGGEAYCRKPGFVSTGVSLSQTLADPGTRMFSSTAFGAAAGAAGA